MTSWLIYENEMKGEHIACNLYINVSASDNYVYF